MAAVLVEKAMKLEQRLEIKTRTHNGKTYDNCFLGTDCVQTIIALKYGHNDQQAVAFGNKLVQAGMIQHVERHHSFKNSNHFYQFVANYETNPKPVSRRGSQSMSHSMSHSYSHSKSKRGKHSMHNKTGSMMTLTSIRDILSKQSFIRRQDVFFRVNKYMRQNRLTDAKTFLRDVLKYIANNNKVDWCILQGPTLNNTDLNLITDAVKEKQLAELLKVSRASWMDVTILECKLTLFYEYHDEDADNLHIRECIHKLESILSALQRSLDNFGTLEIQSYYFRFLQCETRSFLAYAAVKLNKIGYAAHAGIALEHCRKAMKLNPFHALAHGMYGYLLDRCLDKYEEARQYMEYALHLNKYYDAPSSADTAAIEDDSKMSDEEKKKKIRAISKINQFAYIHVWLATLLVNFEEEFRDIEYQMEVKLREEMQQKYQEAAKAKGRRRKMTNEDEDDEMILRTETDDTLPANTPSFESVGSISLVKQLSHAQHFQRKKSHLIQYLQNENTVMTPEAAPTETPNMQSNLSIESEMEQQPSLRGMESMQSLSYTYSEIGGQSVPLITHEQSMLGSPDLETLVAAERLAGATLTKNIVDHFGSDFMEQMGTVPDKPDSHFKLALKLEPQNSRFHSMYGVFLIQQEKYDVAKTHFEKAFKYNPNNIVALNNLGYILTMSRFRHYQQAKNFFMKAAKLKPNNALIQFNLARLLAHAFGSDDEGKADAKRYYLAALMNDKNNSHIHYFYMMFCRFILKDNDTARIHMKKSNELLASELKENKIVFEVGGYIEHAKILQNETRFEAARALLKRAAKLDISRKREIKELLQSMKEEENELSMLLLAN